MTELPADLHAGWERTKKVLNRCWLMLTLLPLALYLMRLIFSPIFPLPTGVTATTGLWALFFWTAAGACLWVAYTVMLTGAEFLFSLFRSRG
jgi:hypothetical protein